jgi:xanthine dehydrogenase YagR molybdenum-binding subunit
MSTQRAVGRSVNRVEGREKVTGAAVYTADHEVPDVAYAVLVQAEVPRGQVTVESLRAGNRLAAAAPGVCCVLTPMNCPPLQAPPRDMSYDLPLERRPPLSDLTVQHVGQHMAVIVADTFENAA